MNPKNRYKLVMAKGNARELVTIVPERELSRASGQTVLSISGSSSLSAEIDKMLEAVDMGGFEGRYPRGFALAHHQVNKNHSRLFVVRSDVAEAHFGGHRVFINPQIVSMEGGRQLETREGCLSHPYRPTRKIKRWDRIVAKWYDRDGKEHQHPIWGLPAQIFQHELDHCDGKTVWIDKLS